MGDPRPQRIVGRYEMYGEIASGGMATVYFGRLVGAEGFARTVAIKRLHPQFAKDPEFVTMFLDEARIASRIRHPNVVPTLDIVNTDGEPFLVMEYVRGASLARLLQAANAAHEGVPPEVLAAILSDALQGLHAAHEAKSESGKPLGIVHRDVSPQNILVGFDGVARVLDFGVAKAVGRARTTRNGQVKGKLAYMAPEQLRAEVIDRRADVYAAGVVLWEALTGRELFTGDSEGSLIRSVLEDVVQPPGRLVAGLAQFDDVTLRALSRDPRKRFDTAKQMAAALDACTAVARANQVGEWVEAIMGTAQASSMSMIRAGTLPPPPGASGGPAGRDDAFARTEVGPPQGSIGALTRTDKRDRTQKFPARATVAGAVVAVAMIAGVFVLRQRAPAVRAGGEPPAAPSVSAVDVAALAPVSASAPIAAVRADAPPQSPPTHPAESVAAPSASVRPSDSHGRRSPHSSDPTPSAASSAQPCPLRSFVDDNGVKQYVRDCAK